MDGVLHKKNFRVKPLELSKESLTIADQRYSALYIPKWIDLQPQITMISYPRSLKTHDWKQVVFIYNMSDSSALQSDHHFFMIMIKNTVKNDIKSKDKQNSASQQSWSVFTLLFRKNIIGYVINEQISVSKPFMNELCGIVFLDRFSKQFGSSCTITFSNSVWKDSSAIRKQKPFFSIF